MAHAFSHRARTLAAASALTLTATLAHSAAIERALPSATRILFEEGTYLEFGATITDPHQSGEGADTTVLGVPLTFSGETGDLFDSNWGYSAAWKNDIGDGRLSYAVLFDQPLGADTNYGDGLMTSAVPGATFNYDGTVADLNVFQFSGVLAYDVIENVKIYGGLRAQRLNGDAAIPFVGPTAGLPGYTVNTDLDWSYGYLVGAAYSRPEIALRVSLSYYSAIEHELETTEFDGVAIPGVQEAGPTETDVETPQSVALEAQTGVAPGTLVFGSIRWVDWSEFRIEPPTYVAVTGLPLVDYSDDWWTYTLGVGRQLTDTLAGSLSVTHEPSVGGALTTLGPHDGRTTMTAALSYDYQRFNIAGGVTYGTLGDTENILETDFNDGRVWGAGLRIGYTF